MCLSAFASVHIALPGHRGKGYKGKWKQTLDSGSIKLTLTVAAAPDFPHWYDVRRIAVGAFRRRKHFEISSFYDGLS